MIMINRRTATLAAALGIALSSLALAWNCAVAQPELAARMQLKGQRIGEIDARLRESGHDVFPVLEGMQRADMLAQSGRPQEAEAILDTLLMNLRMRFGPDVVRD